MDKLIFDRKETDILNRTKKGYYNIEDIERILDYLKYICDYLELDYEFPELSLGSYLTRQKMSAILNVVRKIKENWVVKNGLPNIPSLGTWGYEKANNLEKIIQIFYDFVESDQIDGLYSGTFMAGDYTKIIGDNR